MFISTVGELLSQIGLWLFTVVTSLQSKLSKDGHYPTTVDLGYFYTK